METYLIQELIIAIIIAVVFWIGLFIFDTATGGGGTNVWLITGVIIIAALLVIGIFSAQAALYISIVFHSIAFIFFTYQIIMALIVNRK